MRRYYKGVEVTGSPQGVISFLSTTTVACSVDVDQPRAVATLNPVTSLEFTVSRCEFERVRPWSLVVFDYDGPSRSTRHARHCILHQRILWGRGCLVGLSVVAVAA